MRIENPKQTVFFREYIRCRNCIRQGDITLTEWDVLMHLMEERKEMIERLLEIGHDLMARNMELELQNLALRQNVKKKTRVRTS